MSPLEMKNPDELGPPDEEEGAQESKKRIILKKALMGLGIAVIVSLIVAPAWAGWHYSGIKLDTDTEITSVEGDIQLLDIKIKKEEAKNAVDVSGKQKRITDLLESPDRIPWSTVIEELERVTRDTAITSKNDAIFSFSSYSASNAGTITVSGFTNSYPAIADFIEGVEASSMFEKVKFSSTSKSKEGIVSLNLSFLLEEQKTESDETEAEKPAPTPSS